MPRHGMEDLVILLPGIGGSILKKDDKVVWGYSATSIARTLVTLGGSMRKALDLPHDDPDVDDLGDGITADALMPDLHLLPGVWKIDGYSKFCSTLKATFDLTEGRNFFYFPYDWRRDNRVAARKLARAASTWLASWRQSSGNARARLILVAHSMGGLVARYFLECLEGWKWTRALLTFGTPFRGSLNALNALANGMKKGPLELSDLARQLTAIYQLLPIYECYDSGDGQLVRVGETSGVPNVDSQRSASALAFHREIESAVAMNQQLPEYRAGGYQTYPVVGIAQETMLSARRSGERVTLLPTYRGDALGGDGTVPRVSAIPIELGDAQTSVIYAGTQHGSLQNADAVLQHITGLLSGFDLDLGHFRNLQIQVALDLDDIYMGNQPIGVRARPTRSEVPMTATLWRSGEPRALDTGPLQPMGDGWHALDFASPGPGAYRVRVTGDGVEPAEDAFAVVDFGNNDN